MSNDGWRVEVRTGKAIKEIAFFRIAQVIENDASIFGPKAVDYLKAVADLDENTKYIWSIDTNANLAPLEKTAPLVYGNISANCTLAVHEATMEKLNLMEECGMINAERKKALGKDLFTLIGRKLT